MTTPIGSKTPTPPKTVPTAPRASMSKQTDFLKLIAAQLQYQNPLEPTKDTEFIAQMAQFDSLQKMEELTTTMASLLSLSQLSQTSALIGKQVSATVDGEKVSGVVNRVTVSGGEPTLVIGERRIKLGEVTEIASENVSEKE
ncbi:MAG: flagellar hook capping FlgD N-terminal domain-containing protein [Dehalococcoidia bacterium]